MYSVNAYHSMAKKRALLIGGLLMLSPYLTDPAHANESTLSDSVSIFDFSLDGMKKAAEYGNYTLAWETGVAIREEHEGDPEFDYFYGLSALENGVFHEAVFALERVVTYYPGKLRAHLELGRAYYATQNFSAAEREFEYVIEQQPPENVKANIAPFLQQIRNQRDILDGSFSSTINFSTGYDSNINSATEADSIEQVLIGSILFRDFQIAEESKQSSDSFSKLGVGLNHLKPVSKRAAINSTFKIDYLNNTESDTYDNAIYTLASQFSRFSDNTGFNAGGRYQQVHLDGNPFQGSFHFTAGWQQKSPDDSTLLTTVNISDVNYENSPEKDVYQVLLFTSYSKPYAGMNHNFGLLYGNSKTKTNTNPENGKDYYGLTYSASEVLPKNQIAYLRLLAQFTTYDAKHPDFVKTRDETLYQYSVGWSRTFNKAVSVFVNLTHSDNQSNIEVYQYDRNQIEIGLNYSM